MIKRKRMHSADDIPIDKFCKWSHLCTVPNSEYRSVEHAKKDLKRLEFELLAKEIIIEGCEHYGTYHEVYIKMDVRKDSDFW